MPILAAEIAEYPGELFESWDDAQETRQWTVLYTKPRQEKALARELVRLEIPFYLPLVPRQNLIRGREMTSYVPLFSGYVFLFGTSEERLRSLGTKRVAQAIAVRDGDRLARDLRQIRTLIATGKPLTLESRIAPGRRVRVRQGSMRGLEGIVTERRCQTRLLVTIDFLQQGASMAIEDYLLETLD